MEGGSAQTNLLHGGVEIKVSAPGKVILHGEHSVVYGKLAVAASLGLRTELSLWEIKTPKNEPPALTIELQALKLVHRYNLVELRKALLSKPIPLTKPTSDFNVENPELIDHEAYVALLTSFVSQDTALTSHQVISLVSFLYIFVGFLSSIDVAIDSLRIRLTSELTPAAGTGSSASFAVCVVAAMVQFVKITMPENENVSKEGFKVLKLQDVDQKSFSDKELDVVCRWALGTERIIHGTPSGIDNTICTYGSLVEFRKGTAPKLIKLNRKFKILLINTNVQRNTKALVAKVANLFQKHEPIVTFILEAMEQISLSAIKHLVAISEEKEDAADKIEEHYKSLEELAEVNQNLLAALDVSHPKLNEICEVLRENGLHGKLTGAGGGGNAICLVPPYVGDAVIELVKNTLISKGFEVVLAPLGDRGVSVN